MTRRASAGAGCKQGARLQRQCVGALRHLEELERGGQRLGVVAETGRYLPSQPQVLRGTRRSRDHRQPCRGLVPLPCLRRGGDEERKDGDVFRGQVVRVAERGHRLLRPFLIQENPRPLKGERGFRGIPRFGVRENGEGLGVVLRILVQEPCFQHDRIDQVGPHPQQRIEDPQGLVPVARSRERLGPQEHECRIIR